MKSSNELVDRSSMPNAVRCYYESEAPLSLSSLNFSRTVHNEYRPEGCLPRRWSASCVVWKSSENFVPYDTVQLFPMMSYVQTRNSLVSHSFEDEVAF